MKIEHFYFDLSNKFSIFFHMTFIQLFINDSIQWVCYGFAARLLTKKCTRLYKKNKYLKIARPNKKERIYNVYKLTGSRFENNVLLIKISNKKTLPTSRFPDYLF